MVERDMPPVVDGKEVVARPPLLVAPHPRDAVLLPALHFHDMSDGMLRPAAARLELDASASLSFRSAVVAGFLQTEGMHAENGVITGHALAPGRQSPRDAVAQHARITSEEVEQMAYLEREHVPRMLDRQ